MAIATDPAGARYAVMADVDEECRITEIRSAVEVDEEAASASSADPWFVPVASGVPRPPTPYERDDGP